MKVVFAIDKFRNHPSILNIKDNVEANFKFTTVIEPVVREKINSMDQKKPFTYDDIPTKILVENSDIMSPYITEMYNESKSNAVFPSSIKCTDITPAHKKEEKINANNYSHASSISKIFEKNMYDQIYSYIDKYLSPYMWLSQRF